MWREGQLKRRAVWREGQYREGQCGETDNIEKGSVERRTM